MRRAKYYVVEDDALQVAPLVIQDVGPWDLFPTVTNDAENVLIELRTAGRLPPGRRLLYRDSDGVLTEIIIEHGLLAGFVAVSYP